MKTLHIPIIIMIVFGATPVFALDISQISVGANPWAISVNPYLNKVYVTNFGNNSVSVIDANTNTVTKQIIVGDSPTGVAVNPDTGFVYVSRFSAPVVSVISEKTYTITANITVGSKPNGLGIDTMANEIYVTNMGNGTVSVIDGKTNTVTSTIPVQIRPTAISVNHYTGMAYVTNSGSGTVSVINTKTNAVTNTIQTGKGPTGVAVDNYTNTVYVTDSPTSQVFVIDAKTNTISSTIKVGSNPDGISIDHTKNKIFVANSGDGTVSVIDGNTNVVSDTIPVGTNTYSIATNPITGITYTANDSPGIVYVISGDTTSSSQNVDSPLKQFKSGITAQEVKCNDGLNLVIKSKDNSPACVKETSLGRLVRQGWWAWNDKVGNTIVNTPEKKNFDYKNCAISWTASSIVGTKGFVKDDLPQDGITYPGKNLTGLVGQVIQFSIKPNSEGYITFTYDFNPYPGGDCNVTTKDAIAATNPAKPNISIPELIGSPDILKVDENSVNTSIPPLGNTGDILLNLTSAENLNDHVVKVTYKIFAKPDAQLAKPYYIGFWWHSAVVITIGDSLYTGNAFAGPHYG